MKKKTSRKKVLANQQNAKKSTGPKTTLGKRAVRWNALSHGLLAKATVLTVADFKEDPREFELLLEKLQADLQPEGVLEQILVEKIATVYWRLRRVLRSEKGEVEQGLIDRRQDEISNQELSEQLAADFGNGLLHTRLSQTVEGIARLVDVLGSVRMGVILNGFVTESGQRLLNTFFGKDRLAVTKVCKHLSWIAKKNMELSRRDPPKELVDQPTPEKCRERILSILNKEQCRLDKSVDHVEAVEECQKKATVARLCLPSQAASFKILRYETTIERQLYRAMDQLERQQRRRLGDIVPPPMKVDVTHDT